MGKLGVIVVVLSLTALGMVALLGRKRAHAGPLNTFSDERFNVNRISDAGSPSVWIVTDRQTGREYLFLGASGGVELGPKESR